MKWSVIKLLPKRKLSKSNKRRINNLLSNPANWDDIRKYIWVEGFKWGLFFGYCFNCIIIVLLYIIFLIGKRFI